MNFVFLRLSEIAIVSEHNRLSLREISRIFRGQIGDKPPDSPIEAGLQLGCSLGEHRVAIKLAEGTMHESVEIMTAHHLILSSAQRHNGSSPSDEFCFSSVP
jgi:hypothetical protein